MCVSLNKCPQKSVLKKVAQIAYFDTTFKYVNVDQLKKIVIRDNNTSNESTHDMNASNDFSEQVVEDDPIMDDSDEYMEIPGAWCNVDTNNILPQRTRSGRV